MGCAETHESKSASPPSSLENCIWVNANSPLSSFSQRSLCIDTTTSPQNLSELSSCAVHALPTSHQIVVESNLLDARPSLLHPFSLSDQPAIMPHVKNTFALQFGCSPPLGSPVAYSKMRVPSLHSPHVMVGSTLQGNAAMLALPWSSSVILPSGNGVAHATVPLNSSASRGSPSPSKLEFMQNFVNTLLPQLNRIYSQSSSISLQEKFSAVRLAADMSLAVSAGGNSTWSQALFQELEKSYSSNKGVRKSNSSTPRGRIYTSILRRNTLRGGTYSKRAQVHSHVRNCKVTNSLAITGCSHAKCCRKSPYVRRLRPVASRRHPSYVKILRNSRSSAKLLNVKSPADQDPEASKLHVPSISKERIASLSKLVPGGRNMDVPLLFQEAADYILSLQMQVEVLQSLSHSV